MDREILFKTDDFIFSYRVGGLLIRNDKILLQNPGMIITDYRGHVSCFETTAETLKREFEEEIHAEIGIDRLFAVGEIFFTGDKNHVTKSVCTIKFI